MDKNRGWPFVVVMPDYLAIFPQWPKLCSPHSWEMKRFPLCAHFHRIIDTTSSTLLSLIIKSALRMSPIQSSPLPIQCLLGHKTLSQLFCCYFAEWFFLQRSWSHCKNLIFCGFLTKSWIYFLQKWSAFCWHKRISTEPASISPSTKFRSWLKHSSPVATIGGLVLVLKFTLCFYSL